MGKGQQATGNQEFSILSFPIAKIIMLFHILDTNQNMGRGYGATSLYIKYVSVLIETA